MHRLVIGGRIVAAVAILTLAIVLSLRFGVERWRTNVIKRQIEARTLSVLDGTASRPARSIVARNISSASTALELFPCDVDLYLELGANYRLARDLESAAATYRDALRISRRPEIYLNLSRVRLEQADFEGALEALIPVHRHNRAWLDDAALALIGTQVGEPGRSPADR